MNSAPRRGLFARLMGVALVLGATDGDATPVPDSHWPGKLKQRHKQVVDGYSVSGGRPLHYARNFLDSDAPGAAASVVILRAEALTLAMNDAIWAKYKIGETLKIFDPETKAPATRNPYLHGDLHDDPVVERMLAAGIVFGACNMALHGLSKRLAPNAGVTAEDAANEWTANVVPGITVIPSGVWGLNRAQEAGCTYCSGG